jgi:signal transduction histidine kinase/ActR/RegA family two-component response regulator
MIHKHLSISRIVLVAMLLVATFSITAIGYFFITRSYDTFSREAEQLRARFLTDQRALIRNEVEKAIDYIEYRRANSDERLKSGLRERVNEAHAIATHLHGFYKKTSPGADIERLILEALRPIRFNNGSGYFFVVTMQGVEKLYPVAPQFENQNLLLLQDAKEQYVIRDEIKMVTDHGEGFVYDYWRKPNADDQMIYPKITFVKRFSPLNWYLGTGAYLDDYEKELKSEIIERIAKIRFGTEGYIFINTYEGDAILMDGAQVTRARNLWHLTDPHGVKVIQEERKAVENPEGGYIYYTWNKLTHHQPAPKVSFIKGVADWRWMIGAGVYLDEVERVIDERKSELERNVRNEVTRTILILLLFGVFIVMLVQFFALRMKRGFKAFTEFFRRAATDSISIDEAKLPFSELVELAHSANSMIDDRRKVENEKKVLKERLDRSKKMESLGLLAGGVAHDLNNILSGFVSYPELLLIGLKQDSKFYRPLKTIQECGVRAAAIVNDLLDVSRGSKGVSEVLNINCAVENYLASAEHSVLANRYPATQIERRLAEELHWVNCSSTHLAKTLMNIVSNAMEAIEGQGHVVISTTNRTVAAPIHGYEEIPVGAYVVLAVADNGPGISQEDLARIFEPFFTKKMLGRRGMGLGLAVVWHTVHDHGGFIDVLSSPEGTIFELYFPVSREKPKESAPAVPLEALNGNGERILVVDDERAQREIACALLKQLRYRPEAVASGEAAITWLKGNAADLIVLDMILGPGLNGRQTYEQVLKIRPHQKVIIASGYSETEEVRTTIKLGAGGMITKPYSMEILAQAVHIELRRKQDLF